MRVGIVLLPERRWPEAAKRWQQVEAYGFDHAWTVDHLGWDPFVEGPWFDAMATLTAASTVTSRIRLGTFVSSPNFRHPVPFTRQLLTLDDISGGRFTLGAGSGGHGYDRTVMGTPDLPMPERIARFEEFVQLTDLLLTRPHASFRGRYYTADEAHNHPGCVQRPRLPLLVAANGPRSMRVAARYGEAWLTGPIATEFSGTLGQGVDGWWRTMADLVRRFEDTVVEEGRDPATVDRFATVDGSPLLSLSSVEAYREHLGRAQELGFTDMVSFWPREEGLFAASTSVLEEVAAEVLPEVAREREAVPVAE